MDYKYCVAIAANVDADLIERVVFDIGDVNYVFKGVETLLSHTKEGKVTKEINFKFPESFVGLNYLDMYDHCDVGSVHHFDYFIERSQLNTFELVGVQTDKSISVKVLGTLINVVSSDVEDILTFGKYKVYLKRSEFKYYYKLLDSLAEKSKMKDSVIEHLEWFINDIVEQGGWTVENLSTVVGDVEDQQYKVNGHTVDLYRVRELCSINFNGVPEDINLRAFDKVVAVLNSMKRGGEV